MVVRPVAYHSDIKCLHYFQMDEKSFSMHWSCVFLCHRVSLDLACLGLQVYQVCLDPKAWSDQRETPDFLAAQVYLDDLESMPPQVLKVLYSSVSGFKNAVFLMSANIKTSRAAAACHYGNAGPVKEHIDTYAMVLDVLLVDLQRHLCWLLLSSTSLTRWSWCPWNTWSSWPSRIPRHWLTGESWSSWPTWPNGTTRWDKWGPLVFSVCKRYNFKTVILASVLCSS